jgi:4-amino-4-deoxy-L-arabinose transferase-like glycosyltransferase
LHLDPLANSREDFTMRETHVSLPELGLIAMTRGAAGFGIGLLVADRLSPDQRKALGWGLFLLGALTTIPLALDVLSKSRPGSESVGHSERSLIGV